jgi:hypothetical protein
VYVYAVHGILSVWITDLLQLGLEGASHVIAQGGTRDRHDTALNDRHLIHLRLLSETNTETQTHVEWILCSQDLSIHRFSGPGSDSHNAFVQDASCEHYSDPGSFALASGDIIDQWRRSPLAQT